MGQFTLVESAGRARTFGTHHTGIVIDTENIGFMYIVDDQSPDGAYFVRYNHETSVSQSYTIYTSSNVATIGTALNRFTDGTLLATFKENNNDEHIFLNSADNGETWNILTTDPFKAGGTDYGTTIIDEFNQVYSFPEINQVATPYISIDSGSTWSELRFPNGTSFGSRDRGFIYYNPVWKRVIWAAEGSLNNGAIVGVYNPRGFTDSSGSISGSWDLLNGGTSYQVSCDNWWYDVTLGGLPLPVGMYHEDDGTMHIFYLLENASNDCVVEEVWEWANFYDNNNAPTTGSQILRRDYGIDLYVLGAQVVKDYNGDVHYVLGNQDNDTVLYRKSGSAVNDWTSSISWSSATQPEVQFATLEAYQSGTYPGGTYKGGLIFASNQNSPGTINGNFDYFSTFSFDLAPAGREYNIIFKTGYTSLLGNY